MKLRKPDIITAGFPCQGMSVAGKGGGFTDDRSALFFDFIGLAGRLRPRWLLIENVPGFRTAPKEANGRDFTVALAALDELGYGVAWASLDAQWFGLAQRRERVFLVGYLGGPCPPEILFEPESMRGHSPPGREAGQGPAGTTAACLNSGGNRGGFRTEPGEHLIAGTLTGGQAAGKSHGKKSGTDRPGFLVCGPLCSHDKAHGHQMGSQQAVESGQIVAQPLLGKSNSSHDDSKETYIACYRTAGNCGPFEQDDKAACLNCNTDPNQNILCFDTTQITNKDNRSNPIPGAPCHPLAANQHAPVITFQERTRPNGSRVEIQHDLAYALTSPAGGGRRQEKNIVDSNMMVRRLTPLECERLQGFPDNWTAVKFGKKTMSDSARYRMLGLAVAVPVVQWILGNLQKAGANTVGEVFSGIGGFALAAHRLDMETLWASEICPQAQAVYSRHFPDVEMVGDIKDM